MHLELVGIAVENALLVVCALLAFFLKPNIVFIAGIFLVTKSAALLFNYLVCGKFVIWVYPAVNWKLWKSLLWEATPFALTGILALGIVQLDTIMLRELSPGDPERSVGLYQAAVRLFLVPMLLPQIVTKVFLPQMSRMHGQSGPNLVRDLGRVNHILFTLGLLIGLVTFFRGSDLIRLFYGEKLAAAGPLLQILGITIMMRFGSAYNLYFTIRNRIWFRVVSAIIGLSAVVAFNWILIPKYGAMGSAYASVLAHIVFLVPFFVGLYISEKTFLGWQIPRSVAAGAILVVLLFVTAPVSLLYMLPVYGVAVFCLTFLAIPPYDRLKMLSQYTFTRSVAR